MNDIKTIEKTVRATINILYYLSYECRQLQLFIDSERTIKNITKHIELEGLKRWQK